ncbi:MAG: ABC transporter ATP-binding protein [Syntrophomonadaceae bacterium]|nr:ABC transporter ATP-binding protein [Syntrophomonadaceae bacterium]
MEKPVLMRLENVSKQYQMGEVVVEALKETSLNIYEGEILVIVGPSGSGKSTLLNLVGGMDKPSSGQIFFNGKELSLASDQDLTMYRRQEIGFVFQFYNLIPDLTAAENVALAAELVEESLMIDDALHGVGLLERSQHFPAQLSGGEQQRVSIARALVKKPRFLLCDEPTGALDYQTGKSILGLLDRVKRELGSTVVIVTHNTAIAAMAERVIRMRSGEIIEILVNENPLPPERIEW